MHFLHCIVEVYEYMSHKEHHVSSVSLLATGKNFPLFISRAQLQPTFHLTGQKINDVVRYYKEDYNTPQRASRDQQ